MNKLTKQDLKEIAVRLRKFSNEVIRVKVNATREDILLICKDDHTVKNINVIHSATIDIDGIRFELVVADKTKKRWTT